jgi:hypothetical protein
LIEIERRFGLADRLLAIVMDWLRDRRSGEIDVAYAQIDDG